MAIITLTQLKAFAKEATTTNDAQWTIALNAVNRWIPSYCKRSFAVASAASERLFVPSSIDRVRIADCTTVTSVINNGSTVPSTTYQLEPLNGLNAADQAVPYEEIVLTSGAWVFGYPNRNEATIAVTATWGWAAIPDEVTEAALILGADMYRNREMRNGIVATTDFAGVRARLNPVVLDLLRDLRRSEALVAA